MTPIIGLFSSTSLAQLMGGLKPFRLQPHWFDELELMGSLKNWWEESNLSGNAGFLFHSKLKFLKVKIKAWVKESLGKTDVGFLC